MPRYAVAQADDATVLRARELFQRGIEAYDRGVYFDALQAFQEAYRLRPHPAVRVNIANCYDKLNRPAEAIQNFEQFLGSGGGTPQQQREVALALERLRKLVGQLALHVSPDGASVVIDGGEPLRAPISDVITLPVGRHQLTASLDQHETAMRVTDIHAETTTELAIELAPIEMPVVAPVPVQPPAASPVVQPPAPTPPPAAPVPAIAPLQPSAASARADTGVRIPTGAWVAGSVTLAALLTSIVTGQLALSADRDFNSDLAVVRNNTLPTEQRALAWEDGLDAADRAHSFAVATDVLLSCTVVGTVLTTVLYLNGKSAERGPRVRADVGRLKLEGNF